MRADTAGKIHQDEVGAAGVVDSVNELALVFRDVRRQPHDLAVARELLCGTDAKSIGRDQSDATTLQQPLRRDLGDRGRLAATGGTDKAQHSALTKRGLPRRRRGDDELADRPLQRFHRLTTAQLQPPTAIQQARADNRIERGLFELLKHALLKALLDDASATGRRQQTTVVQRHRLRLQGGHRDIA